MSGETPYDQRIAKCVEQLKCYAPEEWALIIGVHFRDQTAEIERLKQEYEHLRRDCIHAIQVTANSVGFLEPREKLVEKIVDAVNAIGISDDEKGKQT